MLSICVSVCLSACERERRRGGGGECGSLFVASHLSEPGTLVAFIGSVGWGTVALDAKRRLWSQRSCQDLLLAARCGSDVTAIASFVEPFVDAKRSLLLLMLQR